MTDEEYSEAQKEWVKATGVKDGDTVKVIALWDPDSFCLNGNGPGWLKIVRVGMTGTIGWQRDSLIQPVTLDTMTAENREAGLCIELHQPTDYSHNYVFVPFWCVIKIDE